MPNLADTIVTPMRPDAIDLRDRLYIPTLRPLPAELNSPPYFETVSPSPVKNQKNTSACTGYALSSMVELLLAGSGRAVEGAAHPDKGVISPDMLYYHARRYDDLPGDDADGGSTARAAMKAWFKHGAATVDTWRTPAYPRTRNWVADAFKQPMGAYYRVDTNSLADIHAALNETNVLYATACIHEGWYNAGRSGEIPFTTEEEAVGGHAFIIVGYNAKGFWIQNSWGPDWGLNGYGHIKYGDWTRNSWDLWVGQAGVQTSIFIESISQGLSLTEARAGETAERLLSSHESIRAQQLAPFIIDLENNGTLSESGQYSTSAYDLELLVKHYIPSAIADWKLAPTDPIDIAIYAHGGLTDEAGAAGTAAQWIPALYEKKIFPVFIMWESGLLDTLLNFFRDLLPGGRPGAAASGFDPWNWLDERIETSVSGLGTAFWDEMKENAAAATTNSAGGLHQLYKIFQKHGNSLLPRLRIHLVGHSAGACFHSRLLPALVGANLTVDGLYHLAPALRVDEFDKLVRPHLASGKVPCYTQFYLTDKAEQDDECTAAYHKSLLYMVSNAFERKRGTPILGMQKFCGNGLPKPAGVKVWDWILSPNQNPLPDASGASKHGGFGVDPMVIQSVIARISGRAAKKLSPANAAAAAKSTKAPPATKVKIAKKSR